MSLEAVNWQYSQSILIVVNSYSTVKKINHSVMFQGTYTVWLL
jgi:hypothetical protein